MSLHREDLRLVRRLRRGDEAAFEEFFGHAFPGLYRFALQRLGDESLAEEVAQATLCRAVRKLGTYRGEAALFSWLCTICRHRIVDLVRSRNLREESVGLAGDLPLLRAALDAVVDDGDGAATVQRLERAELARWVRHVVDALPRRYGLALRWKYLDDRSVREIGARLGISDKAAESVLTRARVAFREALTALEADARALLEPAADASGET